MATQTKKIKLSLPTQMFIVGLFLLAGFGIAFGMSVFNPLYLLGAMFSAMWCFFASIPMICGDLD